MMGTKRLTRKYPLESIHSKHRTRIILARVLGIPAVFWSGMVSAECTEWSARLVSAQGQVEAQGAEGGAWIPTQPDQRFCPGEKIRTLQHSRASLELPNQTYLSLDQQTTVVFSHVKEDEPSWIDLISGALFSRSRTGKPLHIRTPFVNATIKGTEFLITAGPTEGKVTVFEGEVEASNEAGKVTLVDGQTAVAHHGEAPQLKLELRPEDAVQWALYFPPLLDFEALRKNAKEPAIAEAAGLYSKGDAPAALRALDRVEIAKRDADYTAVRVSILLGVGRVDEAEPLLSAYAGHDKAPAVIVATRAMIALARNHKDDALELAEQALRNDPNCSAAWIAKSYALQASFHLTEALEAIDRAKVLQPDEALIEARCANLLASLNRWSEARKAAERAIEIDPRQPRAYIVKGFVDLRDADVPAAQTDFHKAAELASADPLAWLGSGLASIREGNLKEGTAFLEKAASLGPNDSLVRSYLGKAYYEQKRNPLAEKQFGWAKQFDPKDPTPWYYAAIKKQTENRPVEALYNIQEAIKLNGNRAVYRSRLALDEDLAARSAAQARIYNDLGFSSRALVEGWKSVSVDPANFSAHRLLADSYAALPGQETARASELLQSQLLQPLNSTPIQPHLAESRLLVPSFSGPTQMSFNEFNPVFSRNGFNYQVSGVVGTLDTYGDEAVHSGLWDNLSYSLGQFHYQTQGFRKNNDLDQDIYNAFVQATVTPDLSLQAEYRHRELEHGDLLFKGDLKNDFDASFRRKLRTDIARTGMRYALTPNSDVLASLTYFDTVINSAFVSGLPLSTTSGQQGYLGEAQYLYRQSGFDVILGGGRQSLSATAELGSSFGSSRIGYDLNLTSAYLYSHLRLPQDFTWTLGLSGTDSHNQLINGGSQINPKAGLLWNITPDTVFRVAAFRNFVRGIEVDATLEPTQVAGFNQFFDGYTGSDAWRYGVGLDHRFSPDFLVGAEASRRDVRRPSPIGLSLDAPVFISEQQDDQLRAYTNWTINEDFTARLEYQYNGFTITGASAALSRTHLIPIGFTWFHPSGVSATTSFTYVNQNYFNIAAATIQNNTDFGLVDISLRYRLPQRYGMASLSIKNLLDHHFDYLGQNPIGVRTGRLEETPQFLPTRTISFQLTLAF